MKPKYPRHDLAWYRATMYQLSDDVAPRLDGPESKPGAVAQHVEDLLFVAEMELAETALQTGGCVDTAITALQQAEHAIAHVRERLDRMIGEAAREYNRKAATRGRNGKKRAKPRRS